MYRTIALKIQLFTMLASIGFVLQVAGAAAAGDSGFVYALQDIAGSPNQVWGYRLDSNGP